MRRARHTWLAGVLALCACEPGRNVPRMAASSDSSLPLPTPASEDTTGTEWRIAPNRVGSIGKKTTEAELRQAFGDSVVVRSRIELGEGETTPGAVIFPNDSARRAEIIWHDTLQRRSPDRVVLRGPRSVWRTSRGISLGTSLQELERLNGRPFTLAGFGWDYAGVIIDWKGGTLDSALVGIKLYLDPGPGQDESPAYAQVLGDRDYASSLPAMQQLNPKVGQIFVDFDAERLN